MSFTNRYCQCFKVLKILQLSVKNHLPDAFGHLFAKKRRIAGVSCIIRMVITKLAAKHSKRRTIFIFVALLNGMPVGFAKIKKHSLNEGNKIALHKWNYKKFLCFI